MDTGMERQLAPGLRHSGSYVVLTRGELDLSTLALRFCFRFAFIAAQRCRRSYS